MKLSLLQFSALFLMLVLLSVAAFMQYNGVIRNKRANAVLVMAYQHAK